jgi:hypothetical protein
MELKTQNTFWNDHYIRPRLRGEEPQFPGIYQNVYESWLLDEGEMNRIRSVSDDDRANHFASYIQKTIVHNAPEDLKELASQGRVLLAISNNSTQSTEETSSDFHFFTQEDLENTASGQALNPTDYSLLSTSFKSASTDLREVLDEQVLTHVVAKMKEAGSGFLVKKAQIENHQIVLEVTASNQKNEINRIVISQPSPTESKDSASQGAHPQALVYEFLSDDKSFGSYEENQLPEDFDNLGKVQINQIRALQNNAEALAQQHQSKYKQGNRASSALKAARAFQDLANQANKNNRQRDFRAAHLASRLSEYQKDQKIKGAAVLDNHFAQNVVANKASVSARVNRKNQSYQDQRDYVDQINETNKQAYRDQRQQEQAKKAQTQKQRAQEKKQQNGMLAGAGAAGTGLLGGFAGFTGLSIHTVISQPSDFTANALQSMEPIQHFMDWMLQFSSFSFIYLFT